MKETDWKLHASKTLVRKLKPLRNCTALGSKIGVQQEERAERRAWHLRTHRPGPSARAVAGRRGYRFLRHCFLFGSALQPRLSFGRDRFFLSRAGTNPGSARFVAAQAAAASTADRRRGPGR